MFIYRLYNDTALIDYHRSYVCITGDDVNRGEYLLNFHHSYQSEAQLIWFAHLFLRGKIERVCSLLWELYVYVQFELLQIYVNDT